MRKSCNYYIETPRKSTIVIRERHVVLLFTRKYRIHWLCFPTFFKLFYIFEFSRDSWTDLQPLVLIINVSFRDAIKERRQTIRCWKWFQLCLFGSDSEYSVYSLNTTTRETQQDVHSLNATSSERETQQDIQALVGFRVQVKEELWFQTRQNCVHLRLW